MYWRSCGYVGLRERCELLLHVAARIRSGVFDGTVAKGTTVLPESDGGEVTGRL